MQLRFCVPMVALVGFQMGVGFAWGFIYLKQGLHASGLVIGCSLTFQAAIEVGPPPPPSCNPIHPATRRIEAATGSLQPASPTACITACSPVRAGAPLPHLRLDHRRPGWRAHHTPHHLARRSAPDGRLVGRTHYGHIHYGRAYYGRAYCELTVSLLWLC